MKQLIFLLFLSLPCLLAAQSFCDYNKLYREGKAFAKKRQYKMALYKFNSARRCDPSKGEPVDAAIEALLAQIEGEKRTADRERKRAEVAFIRADSALAEVRKQQEKNEKIINAFYFYANKFALAHKDNKFGFIDKEGNYLIKNIYAEATTFDKYGYAKVKREEIIYLLDTLGQEYLFANNIEQLTQHTTALDLRNKKLDSIPFVVFSQKQLKILLLGSNNLSLLPKEIGQLINLQTLDLSYNELRKIPPELGHLIKLKHLDLSHNLNFAIDFDEITTRRTFTNLPSEIGRLSSLQYLNLDYNKLFGLPDEITNLKSLNVLRLHDTFIRKQRIDHLKTAMSWCKITWEYFDN